MSSKRARRKKRRENYSVESPNKPKEQKAIVEEKSVQKLPGQNFVKMGSALLLVGALLSALSVWWAVKTMQGMTPEELIATTAAAHQTPMSYTIGLVLTSIAAVMQLAFGYQIFRNSNNPFYWKPTIWMASTLAGFELFINIVMIILSRSAINLLTVFYGVVLPLMIVWGANKYKKFAEAHPNYPVPEPIKMF